ncbi:MAG: hypothetical protein ACE5I7_03215 [Candidatus Binatia bacterium]
MTGIKFDDIEKEIVDGTCGNFTVVLRGKVTLGNAARLYLKAGSGPEAVGTVCAPECSSDDKCGNGVVDPGEDCDHANTADGDCCSADCKFAPETTVCRPAVGPCDVAERCTGSSATCPADVRSPDGSVCDDGDACTTSEICSAGVCLAGSAVDCHDHDACTTDWCDHERGCVNVPVPDCVPSEHFCGDGIIDADEECDDGVYNSDTEPDACRTNCRLPGCWDDIPDTPKADLVLVVDRSKSMRSDLRWIQGQLGPLPELLATARFDYRLALVRFGTTTNGGPAEPELVLDFTTDERLFSTAVAGLRSQIVSPIESGTEALDFALDHLKFRPNAERVVLLYTDEDDDLPASLSLRSKEEPPAKWLRSSKAAAFQARIDRTARRLIDNRVLLFMLVNPNDAPTELQYGTPTAVQRDRNGRLDVQATLAELAKRRQRQSLQGQLLAAGLCTSGVCSAGRVGLACTLDTDCALTADAFDIRKTRAGACRRGDLWNSVVAELIANANCEGRSSIDPDDLDADGIVNQVDACTMVSQVGLPTCPPSQNPKGSKIILSNLDAGPQRHGLLARGFFNPATTTPMIDPAAHGVHVRLRDSLGVLYDVSIPGRTTGDPGAAPCSTGDGWKKTVAHGGNTIWRYVNQSGRIPPSCEPGSAHGIHKIVVKDLTNTRRRSFMYLISSKDVALSHLPVFPVERLTFDFTLGAQPAPGTASRQAAAGQCASSDFRVPATVGLVKPTCRRIPKSLQRPIRTLLCQGL